MKVTNEKKNARRAYWLKTRKELPGHLLGEMKRCQAMHTPGGTVRACFYRKVWNFAREEAETL